ncbi:hypothetical protein [Hymenobacter aerophilus]|uniref:hypothetical protein n=1 Tax=Hymenobacter aerophilus TaxID=119644 RepID=UPI00036CB35D|nr:hypothetical protein [Hymenobacter aerophilus]
MTLIKSFTRVSLVTGALLLVPLVAMQFTGEVNWTLSDFVVAGALLLSTGAALELVASRSGTVAYRVAAAGAVLTSLLLVWVNLAVGFVGSGPNPANLLCGAVPAIGLLGALAARFQPRGLVAAMVAAALAQVLVAVLGQLAWKLPVAPVEWAASAVFALLWLSWAGLFQRAAANRATHQSA